MSEIQLMDLRIDFDDFPRTAASAKVLRKSN